MSGTWDNDPGALRRLRLLRWSTRVADAIAGRYLLAYLFGRRGRRG